MEIDIKKLNNRQKKALKNCNIMGKGLEIGASMNPIAPKKMGFDIEIMDHLDRQGLLDKYSNHHYIPPNLNQIVEEVDYVWSGQTYLELIGEQERYDYIITSHLVEHVPNLIQHLNDCSQLLKPNGVYSLIIPDKRYCFDFFRQLTTSKDCVNNYLSNSNNHTIGSSVEYHLNAVTLKGKIGWRSYERLNGFETVHKFEEVKPMLQGSGYVDFHESVFTPASFELLLLDLNMLGFIDFKIESIEAEGKSEFFVTLKKSVEKVQLPETKRVDLLMKIQLELAEPFMNQYKIKNITKRLLKNLWQTAKNATQKDL